jgi:hypothetical protein
MRIFQRVRTVEAVNQIDLFTGQPDGRERRRRQHKRKPPRAPMPARTGAQERDTGIDAVLEHTPESWKMEWLQTIAAMPSGTIFNSDDVRAIVGDPPLACVAWLSRSRRTTKASDQKRMLASS